MATRGPFTYTTGSTLRAMLFKTDGKVRDVVANTWDTWANADIDDYDITCSELGTSGIYTFADPTGVTASDILGFVVYTGAVSLANIRLPLWVEVLSTTTASGGVTDVTSILTILQSKARA
jgi:hypothetical protein